MLYGDEKKDLGGSEWPIILPPLAQSLARIDDYPNTLYKAEAELCVREEETEKEAIALARTRKNPRKERFLFEDSCRLLCARVYVYLHTGIVPAENEVEEEDEDEEGGEVEDVSRLWASISRGEEPRELLPSLVSLLPRILASIILRSTTPEPSSEIRRGIARAYVRTSSSGIPFREASPSLWPMAEDEPGDWR